MFAAKFLAVLSVLAVASAAPCKEVEDWSASDVASSAAPSATSQIGYGAAAAEVSSAYSAAAVSASGASSAAPAATSEAAAEPSSAAAEQSSAAPAAASSASSTGSASSPASGSSSGTATYYAVGLGACGWTNSDSDYVVAMNAAQYSSGTCGQNIQITNPSTGKSTTAQIVDLCPGCASGDLDMSPTLFSYLNDGNMDAGIFQMTWSYA